MVFVSNEESDKVFLSDYIMGHQHECMPWHYGVALANHNFAFRQFVQTRSMSPQACFEVI
jgi:hypothetical protein